MREIILDLETAPHPCAGEFIPAPDLDTITPAKNLVDPQKKAEDIAKKKAAAQAEYESACGRAALDWNLSRIVALAWDHGGEPRVLTCADEASEMAALDAFWQAARGRRLVGFCARTFDVPTLIQRSRLLGVSHYHVNLGRYGRGDVLDLRDVLTFEDARYEAIMPRSLKAFCRRFGIPVDDAINGADIPALVAAGDWESVKAHVLSDLRLTAALHARLFPVYQEAAI